MRQLFDQNDEQAVLDELSRNQHKAEQLSQTNMHQGRPREARSWAVLAQRAGEKIALLTGIFQHKN